MFLIQYDDNHFINAEDISYIFIKPTQISFNLRGDSETGYDVSEMMHKSFLNQLGELNGSLTNVASFYAQLDKG